MRRTTRIGNLNPGKQFEDAFENVLFSHSIIFNREGSKRNYGAAASNKGKFDFCMEGAAVECKSIAKDSDLALPWFGRKSPKIQTHQLKALREFNGIAGLLIEVRSKEKIYWLPIKQLDQIIIAHGPVKNLLSKYLDEFAVTLNSLEDWITIYKGGVKHK